MECCSLNKDDALLPAQPAPPKKSQEDKENIDPCPLQQHISGFSSMLGAPASKQHFAKNCSSSSSAKGRTPLADITALCMLQASMPPKQQHGTGLGPVVQKGLWGQANHVDKIGAGSTSGSGMASGHRLAAMR